MEIFILLIIAFLVIVYGSAFLAKMDKVVEVDAPASEALAVAESCFGVLWKEEYGSGHLNFVRRFLYVPNGGSKPVLSIAVLDDGQPENAPTCRVLISMTSWSSQYGAVFGGESIVVKKAWVAWRLSQLIGGSSAGPQQYGPPGNPANAPGQNVSHPQPGSVGPGPVGPGPVGPGTMGPGTMGSPPGAGAPMPGPVHGSGAADTGPVDGSGYQRFPGVG